jgi:hypothetical protein
MKNKKWYCPHCSQTSSRHWNLKKHIERKHQGRGQPIREDGWHSISTNTSTATHYIPDMMSLQNNNYHLNQRYQQTPFSASPYPKIEDTSKKRELLDEILEPWRSLAQKMKEIMEIKKIFNEFSSFSSSSQQPNFITSLGQTPMIQPIIPLVTTPLQPTPPAPQEQEQEQKKKNIDPWTTFNPKLFLPSTFQIEEFQRRLREEKIEDFIVNPLELLPLPIITITPDDNNNNNSIKSVQAKITTKSIKAEEQIEEDIYDIEEHLSSKSNLQIDDNDDYNSSINNGYFLGRYWVIKRNGRGDIIDAYKVITDPLLEAQESYYQEKKKAAERMEQKERALLDLS